MKPVGPIVADLNGEATVHDFEHGHGLDLTLAGAAFGAAGRAAGNHAATLKLLHAEADALLLDVDVEHDRLNGLALAVKRQRFLARHAPGDVRHVDHAVDVAVEADEQAELGGVLDFALDLAADRVLLGEVVPRVGLGLLEAEADAALLAVDLEDLDLDFLAKC
jgi:hypothetical protein